MHVVRSRAVCCCLHFVQYVTVDFCYQNLVLFYKLHVTAMPNTDSNATTSSSETKDETGLDELAAAIDFSAPAKQEARAYLRERFLRVITGIVGKPAKFDLYENTKVTAEFRGCDIDFLELYVRKLTTPLGTVPEAILRTNDVIVLEMDNIK